MKAEITMHPESIFYPDWRFLQRTGPCIQAGFPAQGGPQGAFPGPPSAAPSSLFLLLILPSPTPATPQPRRQPLGAQPQASGAHRRRRPRGSPGQNGLPPLLGSLRQVGAPPRLPGTFHSVPRSDLNRVSRWLHSGSSNMAVIEVPMISGFRADVESLERVGKITPTYVHIVFRSKILKLFVSRGSLRGEIFFFFPSTLP